MPVFPFIFHGIIFIYLFVFSKDMADYDLFEELRGRKIISVKDYRLRLAGSIDLSMYGSGAWADTLQKIGEKNGNIFLFNRGYSMGEVSVEEIKEKGDDIPEDMRGAENYIMMCGFGNVEISQSAGKLNINVKWNHIIRLAKEMYGDESLICEFYRGIYNAFADAFIGKTRLEESMCICKGNTHCSFKGDYDVR